jgi:hypothetical protein
VRLADPPFRLERKPSSVRTASDTS